MPNNRFTPEQVAALTLKPGYGITECAISKRGNVTITPLYEPPPSPKEACAKLPPKPVTSVAGSPDGWPDSEMNKAERKFAEYLKTLKAQGIVKDFKAQSIKLMLARNTGYTSDFFVEAVRLPLDNADAPYTLYFVEVKALWGDKMHWEDDARAKTKIAAKMYPQFRFMAVAWNNKTKAWESELIRP